MTLHDFKPLFDAYPAVIAGMPPDVFTSHAFLLRLAQMNQAEYVDALYAYRNTMHGKTHTPFKTVHQVLSDHLNALPELVERVGSVMSEDIWRNSNACTQWRKL